MNKEYIANALSEIEDDFIIEASSICDMNRFSFSKKHRKTFRLGIALAIAAMITVLFINRNMIVFPFATNTTDYSEDETAQPDTTQVPTAATNPDKKGLYIPRSQVDLVARDDVSYSWAAPLVVYNSRSYSGLGFAEEVDNSLLEEHLGTCTGLLEAGSDPSEYVDFSGNIDGELYAVKGYDTDFMIGLQSSYSDSSNTFTPLINDNDITLTTGADIFEERLHLAGNYTKVTYQSRKDWYHAKGNIKIFDNASSDIITNFVTALNQGEVMHIDSIPLKDKDSSIYDENELCHLLFYKKDGIVVELRCLKGGYVIFDGMRQVCVKIPKKSFNQVCYAFDK